MPHTSYPVQIGSEGRMDMRTMIEVLVRRRWIIAAVALPVIFFAAIGTIRTTQHHLARSVLMIEIAGPQAPAFGQVRANYDMAISSAAELAMSMPIASLAALALADSLPVYRERYSEHFSTTRTVADLQRVLHRGASSNHIGESNMISLGFSHPNPEFSLIGARALVDAFIDYSIESRRISPAVQYYAEQVEATQREIEDLVAQRVALLEAGGLASQVPDSRVLIDQIRFLENQYFQARSRREGLEARIHALSNAIAADPDFVPALSSNEIASINNLRNELYSRLVRLATLRESYQEDSIWIKRELEPIETLRQEIHLELTRYLESLKVNLAEARSVEDSYLVAIRMQAKSLQDYPSVRGHVETIDLRITGLQKLLQSLQHKHGEVRMAADTDLRISDIRLIQTPVLGPSVGHGRKFLYLFIASVLALALGLIAAFFVESNDHRIYTRRQAELFLEVPVLGFLPDTSRISRA